MLLIEENPEVNGRFNIRQMCVVLNKETREMKWPIHVTYHTSTGKTGSFVFSTGQFEELQLELEEDEAVWFNKDMLGFYLPLPTPEYFQEKILPKISLFSDAD